MTFLRIISYWSLIKRLRGRRGFKAVPLQIQILYNKKQRQKRIWDSHLFGCKLLTLMTMMMIRLLMTISIVFPGWEWKLLRLWGAGAVEIPRISFFLSVSKVDFSQQSMFFIIDLKSTQKNRITRIFSTNLITFSYFLNFPPELMSKIFSKKQNQLNDKVVASFFTTNLCENQQQQFSIEIFCTQLIHFPTIFPQFSLFCWKIFN